MGRNLLSEFRSDFQILLLTVAHEQRWAKTTMKGLLVLIFTIKIKSYIFK